jgi:hypothetical protein
VLVTKNQCKTSIQPARYWRCPDDRRDGVEGTAFAGDS